jgi:hypothetical protein
MNNIYRFFGLNLLLILLGLACSHSEQNETEQNDQALWGKRLDLKEEFRIGSGTESEEYMFGNIKFIRTSENGNFLVADQDNMQVRLYNKKGEYIKNLGGVGGGPGEYRNIGGVSSYINGGWALWDNRLLRVSVYDSLGNFQVSYSVESSLYADDLFETDHEGNFYIKTVTRGIETGNWEFGYISISQKGENLGIIDVPVFKEKEEAQSFTLVTPVGSDNPFPVDLIYTMGKEGTLIYGINNRYEINFLKNDRFYHKIERFYLPVEIHSDEKAQWNAWIEYYSNRLKIGVQIPDYKPAFKRIQSDSEGRVWVKRYADSVERPPHEALHYGPPSPWREPPTYDLFNEKGLFLGSVVLPWNSTLHDARGRQLWIEKISDSGEPVVIKMVIQESVN